MSHRSIMVLLGCMLASILASGQLYVLIPVVNQVALRFSVDGQTAGQLGPAFGLAYAFGFLIWGPISDRYGRRSSLLAGISLAFMATCLVASATTFHWAMAGRIAQGLSAAAIPPAGLALISELLTDEWRPFGQGLMGFSFIASAPISQFAAEKLSLAGGSFPALMAYVAVGFIFSLTVLALTIPHKNDHGSHKHHLFLRSFIELSKDSVVPTVWISVSTVLMGFVAFQIMMAGPLQSGYWSSSDVRFFTLLGLFASFGAGFLIRKFKDINLLRGGLIIECLSLLSARYSLFPLPLVIVFLSIGVALSIPSVISVIARRATHTSRGMGISVYSFFLFIGASLAPVLVKLIMPSVEDVLLVSACIPLMGACLVSMPWMRVS